MKSKDASSDETNGESKISIPYTNNFENVVTSSASIVKDNPVNVSSSSSNNSNNAHGRKPTTTNKKKMLASSDSDFFSLLRYNSERWKKINCFSVNSSSNSNAGNRPKNMIYALSDSDFLITGVTNEKNKRQHLNNVERKCQAIPNKSDILNFLINEKSINYKNLLDGSTTTDKVAPNNHNINHHHPNNSNTHHHHNHHQTCGKDEFYAKKKLIESISLNDGEISAVDSSKNQKNETSSLPPLLNDTHQHRATLNNSLSIDTVLLNMKNTNNLCEKCPSTNIAPSSYNSHVAVLPASPKSLNNDDSLQVNIPPQQSSNLIVSPGHIKKSNLLQDDQQQQQHNFLQPPAAPHFVSVPPPPLHDTDEKRVTSNGANGSSNGGEVNMKSYDVMDPVALDDRSRKRTPSTVTYNVNVINFESDDTEAMSGGYGKRSNSSTSECVLLFLSFFLISLPFIPNYSILSFLLIPLLSHLLLLYHISHRFFALLVLMR